jgi:hypothetical protein
MNKENLQKAITYMKTVPQELINMSNYKTITDNLNHKCGSTGCVIGHCSVLDTEPLPKFDEGGNINFAQWSEDWFGLNLYGSDLIWDFMFSSNWSNYKEQIIKRMEYVLNNGAIPEEWCMGNWEYKL